MYKNIRMGNTKAMQDQTEMYNFPNQKISNSLCILDSNTNSEIDITKDLADGKDLKACTEVISKPPIPPTIPEPRKSVFSAKLSACVKAKGSKGGMPLKESYKGFDRFNQPSQVRSLDWLL